MEYGRELVHSTIPTERKHSLDGLDRLDSSSLLLRRSNSAIHAGVYVQLKQQDGCKSGPESECSHGLSWFDELPRVLQYNKYVRSGYRAGQFAPHFSPHA